jgi:hypothetical protein
LREFAQCGYFRKNPPITMLSEAPAELYGSDESLVYLPIPFGIAYLKYDGKTFNLTRERIGVIETKNADWLAKLDSIVLIPQRNSEGNIDRILVKGYENQYRPVYGMIEPSKDGEGLVAYKTE